MNAARWLVVLTAPLLLAQTPRSTKKPVAGKTVGHKAEARAIDQTINQNRKAATPPEVKSRGPLGTWEQERIRVFQNAKASVVFVTTLTGPNTFDERQVPSGSGSGLVWDDAGHVVTNFHVVQTALTGGETLEITLADGKRYKAKVIGHSALYDTAVLQVFAPLADLKPLALGVSKNLQVGQSVLAIGNPFGLDHTMTAGIVSALNRSLPTSATTTIPNVIQTDAAINPGNSGGPLLDSAGRLIGMNTAIAPVTGASVGIGFSIPVDTLARVVPVLIADGKLARPYLGFTGSSAAAHFPMLQQGMLVREVEPNSPAHRAGLIPWFIEESSPNNLRIRVGDIILRCNDQPVGNEISFMAMMEGMGKEKQLVFDVWRNCEIGDGILFGGRIVKVTLYPEAVTPPKPKVQI